MVSLEGGHCRRFTSKLPLVPWCRGGGEDTAQLIRACARTG
jgi:hypothetical protein